MLSHVAPLGGPRLPSERCRLEIGTGQTVPESDPDPQHLTISCATNANPSREGGKQCCMGDEGRPLEIGLQGQVSNHLELLGSRARVVSVEEKARHECVRYGPRRRTRVNR